MAINLSSPGLRANWKYLTTHNALFSKNVRELVQRTPSQKIYKNNGALLCVRNIHGPQLKNEYLKEAIYPAIKKYKNATEEEEAKLIQAVKDLDTVEEKLYYVNKPKYYGWQSFVINSSKIKPTSLDFVQYITNTTLVENELPPIYNLKELYASQDDKTNVNLNLNANSEEFGVKKLDTLESRAQAATEILDPIIRNFILDFEIDTEKSFEVKDDKILFHEDFKRPEPLYLNELKRANALVIGINKILQSYFAATESHLGLENATVDLYPRNEAFWFRGPINADSRMVSRRLGKERTKARHEGRSITDIDQQIIHEPYDRAIQFIGDAILQLRCKRSISPFLSKGDPLCMQGHVPEYTYDPKYLGYPRKAQFGTNLSGHWTGVDKDFCHLQMVSNIQKNESSSNSTAWNSESPYNERQDMLTSKAILSCFGQCMAQACFQGFSPFNDPLVPLTNQTIVTDGRRWKFSVYQMNKSALQGLSETNENMHRNVCWHLPEQELYSHVDFEKKTVEGFDPLVLKALIKFYLIEPTTSKIANDGYLGERKHLYNVKNDYNRQYLHSAVRMMYSKRPRHLMRPDIEPYQRLHYLRHKSFWYIRSCYREKPWFIMKDHDHMGREHWDPEFKTFEYHNGPYVPKKFRPAKRNFHKIHPGVHTLKKNRGRIVGAPLPPDTTK